ncbi:UDP-N-acetylmuramoylalanine--D-glutamate ligase [Clostridium amylolyticum]|uniref:UDP-N-acetylmuramoylalanine--D-glutamate ligase n=1 Tax=Clostridium amylolyticum TaxID=1121298 RepID=A0A1M6LDU7_9CLOT|nr:UDP-N-acetylmuramoyl-L-alanine--D-glutamate ligase [Clostridium amylolyticum]SHJ69327.1 UDP-N-acetylmuramoylalanine--D-glutamate ligase [Clostridium amylolyticum]
MKRDFSEFKEFIKGKKTAVVGIGVSNIPLINFLIKLGAEVTAFDKKTEEMLGNTAVDLKNRNIKLELGEGYLDKLHGFEVIFKSPSMRIDSPAFTKARAEGAYITSEMEEFVRYCPAKIFGITGSDGKTTTTSIVYNLLKEQGYNTWVGGNIGNPLFSNIEEMKEDHKVVLELSSFQLMTMDSPIDVAIVTNITPNHLDMHKGMEEYIDSKKNIFKYQKEDGLLILNRENDITYSFFNEAKGKAELFSSKRIIENGAYYNEGKLYLKEKEVCSKDDIVIKGMHNVENYLAAFLAVQNEVTIHTMKKVAMSFKGVYHRNELVREFKGVRYYNDSIGSSPTRTLATISVFDKPVILIAGGYDKNIPFEPLAEKGYDKIKALVLLGVTKDKIKKVFDEVIDERNLHLPIYMVDTLENAVIKCREIAEEGDNVVLSPACASFDMFPNFEVRGEKFRELVNNF